ncbi:MAG: hypothetical protein ACI81G_001189, partial [Gammaproteobacteria bacterium]
MRKVILSILGLLLIGGAYVASNAIVSAN